ncbi:MAG: aminomethyl-transferring glycine dehydrogenase subunit GcvPB, partial [Chloroflexota bacterium]
PGPIVTIVEEGTDEIPPLFGFMMPKKSIGRVKSFFGHFGMMVRAYTYISMHGPDGLRKISEYAVLNANYLLTHLKGKYKLPYPRTCMHELVLEGHWDDADVHALDIAKRLMDYKFHPPTNYFPLIVHEALMIEPTETENKQTLDSFTEALISIANEARTNPELIKTAPHDTPFGRMDEVKAARELVLCCWLPEGITLD